MKRQKYRITSTVGHRVTKYSWNAAVRETEKLVKGLAQQTGAVYHLTDGHSLKQDFYHVSGSRVWTNQINGAKVVFTIQLEENP